MAKAKKKPMGDVALRGTVLAAVRAGNEDDAPVAARSSRKKDLEKVMYRLRGDQIAALRGEAFKRAQAGGSGRPDASEVLRDILDGKVAAGSVMGARRKE